MPRIKEYGPITSVWSAFGHRFMAEGDADEYGNMMEGCLTCGAVYWLVRDADDPARGEYRSATGAGPMRCTGDTGMAHGYPGERYCHEHMHPRDDSDHECNCLLCDS